MTPEETARQRIDEMLTAPVGSSRPRTRSTSPPRAALPVVELSFKTGEPDYTLFAVPKRRHRRGEAEGHSLVGVEEQSTKYVSGVPFGLPAWKSPLPSVTRAPARRHSSPTASIRPLQPPGLRVPSARDASNLGPTGEAACSTPLRVATAGGRLALARANSGRHGPREIFRAALRRALIQMATGSGKTYTAVNFIYRLVKYVVRAASFPGDRGNLGRQTLKNFSSSSRR